MSIRNELLQDILDAILNGGGALPSDNLRVGIFDYNDLATSTTPINIPATGIGVDLPNDELGAFTNKLYAPIGVADVWNSSTGLFDFTQLKLGDMVDIRLDIDVITTQPNQNVEIDLLVAVGGAQYSIPFVSQQFKNAGLKKINRYNGIYLGDSNTLNNGAKFSIRSDAIASATVNGWYCKVLIRG